MTRIDPGSLSGEYRVTQAEPSDADSLFGLYSSNSQYFEHFSIEPTKERLTEDMTMLPDGCDREQKHFLVYHYGDSPAAILDLIEDYPSEGTCYIGLFMVRADLTGRGIGTAIISELCVTLSALGFKAIRLAYGKNYARAEHFWTKNGFVPEREAFLEEYGELIVAQRASGGGS